MSNDYSDNQERKEEGGEAPTRKTWGGRLNEKCPLFRLKKYVIVILLAGLVLLTVLMFNVINNNSIARTGAGASAGIGAGVGCGGCSTASQDSADFVERLRRLGLDFYAARYGDTAVQAQVRDFGCHQEIYILKDGQLVMRLAYQGGELYELPEV